MWGTCSAQNHQHHCRPFIFSESSCLPSVKWASVTMNTATGWDGSNVVEEDLHTHKMAKRCWAMKAHPPDPWNGKDNQSSWLFPPLCRPDAEGAHWLLSSCWCTQTSQGLCRSSAAVWNSAALCLTPVCVTRLVSLKTIWTKLWKCYRCQATYTYHYPPVNVRLRQPPLFVCSVSVTAGSFQTAIPHSCLWLSGT